MPSGGNLSVNWSIRLFPSLRNIARDSCFVAVNPEMYQAKTGITPLSTYLVFCVCSDCGSRHFIVEQGDRHAWICERCLPFIDHPLKCMKAEVSG